MNYILTKQHMVHINMVYGAQDCFNS